MQLSIEIRDCGVSARQKDDPPTRRLLSSRQKFESGPTFTNFPRRKWPWSCESRASIYGFVLWPSQQSWRRTHSGASFSADPVQGSRSRAGRRGIVPIGSGSRQRSGCARSAGRGYSRLQPPCLNPSVNGILDGVPEIRLFVVEIILECATISVGVDVVVQLAVRCTSRRDGPFGNVLKNLGFGPLDSVFECRPSRCSHSVTINHMLFHVKTCS